MNAHGSTSLCLALSLASLCSTACDDSLKSVSLIQETRVLGARVESQADPNQASPKPGEQASLRLFVAAPEPVPEFSYALSICAVHPSNSGFPSCASPPFASTVQAEPSDADARLDFQVPEDVELESTPHAFARGLICAESSLIAAPDGSWSCVTGSGTQVAFEFSLGGTEDSNLNPNFGSDAFSLDGEPWPASSQASCEAGSLPQVRAKSLHALHVTLSESDFEPLAQPTSVDPARETLLVSSFSSGGKLEHGLLALSADTPPEQRALNWSAPALADGVPQLLRFYFVVRDARSGEDFANRALCVVP